MEVETVAKGVHRLADGMVNCYVIEDEGGCTLVDSLFPRSGAQIGKTLAELGRSLDDLRAVLITHGHADHMGGAEHLGSHAGVDVCAHPAEFDLLRGQRPVSQPAGLLRQMVPHLWRRQAWRLVFHGLRHGFLRPTWVADPVPVVDGQRLDVPGRPIVLHTPGHTRGHLAFHLPDSRAIISGDALTTFDALTGQRGPQIESLTEDAVTARQSLDRFTPLDADVILPGHGPPWRGRVSDAVARARLSTNV